MVIAEGRFKVVAQKPRCQPKVCSAKLRDEVTRETFCAEVKRYLDESDIVEGVEQSWANTLLYWASLIPKFKQIYIELNL